LSQPWQAIALKQTHLDHDITKAMSDYVNAERWVTQLQAPSDCS